MAFVVSAPYTFISRKKGPVSMIPQMPFLYKYL